MSAFRSLGRFLRNRKIAVALIVVTGLVAAVGTLPGVEGWYGNPIFIALVVWLTLATAACSWERTQWARRLAADPGVVSESLAKRLKDRPELTLPAGEMDAAAVADALAGMGLRIRKGPTLVVGWAGRTGLLGSPLFHWSLVLLSVAIILGQATQSTGLIGVPLGASVEERAESYGVLETGPFFGAHSGLTFAVEDWKRTFVVEGVDRGPVPTVAILRGGSVLTRQDVYPNRPLRYGSFLVHMNDWGLAANLSVETTAGESLGSLPVLVDFTDESRADTKWSESEYVGTDGEVTRVTVRLVRPEAAASETTPAAIITADAIVRLGEGDVPETRLANDGRTPLPDGNVLVYQGSVPYARLSVVKDWSVIPIYALLVTATIGLALSLLVPYRVVWVLVSETGESRQLRVVTRHVRRDPLFTERVVYVLSPDEQPEKDVSA